VSGVVAGCWLVVVMRKLVRVLEDTLLGFIFFSSTTRSSDLSKGVKQFYCLLIQYWAKHKHIITIVALFFLSC